MFDRPKPHQNKAARALFVATAALLVTGAVAAACGGSASESPWPVEPEHLVTDPEGEDGRRPARKETPPDAGTAPDSGPNVEP